ETGEGLDDERADRREVVAALLHDDGREPERAENTAGLAVARGCHLERALGVAGRGVDAERDDERASGRGEGGGLADGCEPGFIAAAGGEGRVEIRGVVLRLEAEEVGEPARSG